MTKMNFKNSNSGACPLFPLSSQASIPEKKSLEFWLKKLSIYKSLSDGQTLVTRCIILHQPNVQFSESTRLRIIKCHS